MNFPSSIKIHLATTHCDMRKSIDGLAWEVQSRFDMDVLDGAVFVFYNRNKDKLKYIYYDGTGFCLFYKRLAKGRFKIPPLKNDCYQMSEAQLRLLLEGVEWSKIKPNRKQKYSQMF
ncbi:IS66 Orf2 like protein [Piscirickettsia salmonis]|uniref:IS66 family insertion sequence element accessory protein TnpB n=1 Tax=Piscirickettsia salmonis TaxID=1238 RepID=UPI0012BB0A73|nr:IS66 family insertion sequence element accessory protein TnpB [Piscirickettsia salmonis]QGP54792.1 IS66 Orf2 like protein [Piscirickettsia salmonis]QGP59198.1 IS66 Orf2 like protein [Piscirickettsia salmonis]QGP59315.1 IS66 Orf2 like protein [Piscirickettsia salmonis]QGP64020.1 IS66 Orf2 like protein [Piscirickettsia salmonis]